MDQEDCNIVKAVFSTTILVGISYFFMSKLNKYRNASCITHDFSDTVQCFNGTMDKLLSLQKSISDDLRYVKLHMKQNDVVDRLINIEKNMSAGLDHIENEGPFWVDVDSSDSSDESDEEIQDEYPVIPQIHIENPVTESHNKDSHNKDIEDSHNKDIEDSHNKDIEDSHVEDIITVNDNLDCDNFEQLEKIQSELTSKHLSDDLENTSDDDHAGIAKEELSKEQGSLENTAETLLLLTKKLSEVFNNSTHITDKKKLELSSLLNGVPNIISRMVDMEDQTDLENESKILMETMMSFRK